MSILTSSESLTSDDPDEGRTPDGGRDTRNPDELDETNAFGAQSIITDFLASDLDVPEPFIAKFDVQSIIENGPQDLMSGVKRSERKDKIDTEFRWIHLPANNMYWVEVRAASQSAVSNVKITLGNHQHGVQGILELQSSR